MKNVYSKPSMNNKCSGFTLVELAIVMTIIGLLIGGILKGQELLQNARMLSGASQLKSYNAAVTTFRDMYQALPGDMAVIDVVPNCPPSFCNVAGDGNGIIGLENLGASLGENNTFWMQLAGAGLITGIDPNSSWTSSTRYADTAPHPKFALGGKTGVFYASAYGAPRYAITGYVWYLVASSTGNATLPSLPQSQIAKYDGKFDDGNPNSGEVLAEFSCVIAAGNLVYDPNGNTLCRMIVKSVF